MITIQLFDSSHHLLPLPSDGCATTMQTSIAALIQDVAFRQFVTQKLGLHGTAPVTLDFTLTATSITIQQSQIAPSASASASASTASYPPPRLLPPQEFPLTTSEPVAPICQRAFTQMQTAFLMHQSHEHPVICFPLVPLRTDDDELRRRLAEMEAKVGEMYPTFQSITATFHDSTAEVERQAAEDLLRTLDQTE